MDINEKSDKFVKSISNFSNVEDLDRQDLENVIVFGQKAISTLEGLVDAVLEPLVSAKKDLYKTQNPESANVHLAKLASDFYDDLDEAQSIVLRFETLKDNFGRDIQPILSKYCDRQVIDEWWEIIDSTYGSRAASYESVESLIPKIEVFLDARYSHNDEREISFIDIKNYINEVIKEMRETKKNLQKTKANFLQLSGLNGLTRITDAKIDSDSEIKELDNRLDKIKELVASGRIETALEELEELCLYNYPEIVKDIVLLQSQFSKRNRDFFTGVDDDQITPNKISFGILELIKEIKRREKHVK